jgi:hypothetical protein
MGQHAAATSDENEHATTNSRKRHFAATKENHYRPIALGEIE